MAALFTEDGGFTGPQIEPTRSDFSPPAVINERMAAWFAYVDYTDVEHLDVIVEDNTVVVVSANIEHKNVTQICHSNFNASFMDV